MYLTLPFLCNNQQHAGTLSHLQEGLVLFQYVKFEDLRLQEDRIVRTKLVSSFLPRNKNIEKVFSDDQSRVSFVVTPATAASSSSDRMDLKKMCLFHGNMLHSTILETELFCYQKGTELNSPDVIGQKDTFLSSCTFKADHWVFRKKKNQQRGEVNCFAQLNGLV